MPAPAEPHVGDSRAYASTRGFAIYLRQSTERRRWLWARGSTISPVDYPDEDAAWSAAALEAWMTETRRTGIAMRISYLATRGYVAAPQTSQAASELMATIAGLAAVLADTTGSMEYNPTASPPPGWPPGEPLSADASQWAEMFRDGVEQASGPSDQPVYTAWFAAALARGFEEALMQLASGHIGAVADALRGKPDLPPK